MQIYYAAPQDNADSKTCVHKLILDVSVMTCEAVKKERRTQIHNVQERGLMRDQTGST